MDKLAIPNPSTILDQYSNTIISQVIFNDISILEDGYHHFGSDNEARYTVPGFTHDFRWIEYLRFMVVGHVIICLSSSRNDSVECLQALLGVRF